MYKHLFSLSITLVFFISLSAYFISNFHYLEPTTLTIEGVSEEGNKAILSWNLGKGFNPYSNQEIQLYNSTTEGQQNTDLFTQKIPFPPQSVTAVRISAAEHGKLSGITSVTISTAANSLQLPIKKLAKNKMATWKNLQIKRITYHPALVSLQIIFAAFITWLFFLFLNLPTRLQQPNWRRCLIFIFCEERRLLFWLMFICMIVVYSLWLLAYWPAAMTNDSWSSLSNAYRLDFNDWHPYIYTVLILFCLQFFDSVASVAVLQILTTALLGSYVFYYVLKNGIRPFLVYPFFLLYTFSIPIGLYNIILWKDVPFSLAVAAFSVLLFTLSICRYKCKQSYSLPYWSYPFLFILFSLLCSVRHNGFPFFIVGPFLLYFAVSRSTWIKLLTIFVSSYIVFHLIIPKSFNIQKVGGSGYHLCRSVLQIMTHPNFYSEDREADFRIMEQVTGRKWADIKSMYPARWYDLWDSTLLSKSQWNKDRGETEAYNQKFFIRLILENLPIFLTERTYDLLHSFGLDDSHYGPKTGYFTNPLQLHGSNLGPPGNFVYGIGLSSKPKSSWLFEILDPLVLWSKKFSGLFSPAVIIWNLLLPSLLLFFILFISKGFSPISLFVLVNLAAAGVMFLLGAGESWRYFYYLYLSSILVLPLYFVQLHIEKTGTANSL